MNNQQSINNYLFDIYLQSINIKTKKVLSTFEY